MGESGLHAANSPRNKLNQGYCGKDTQGSRRVECAGEGCAKHDGALVSAVASQPESPRFISWADFARVLLQLQFLPQTSKTRLRLTSSPCPSPCPRGPDLDLVPLKLQPAAPQKKMGQTQRTKSTVHTPLPSVLASMLSSAKPLTPPICTMCAAISLSGSNFALPPEEEANPSSRF